MYTSFLVCFLLSFAAARHEAYEGYAIYEVATKIYEHFVALGNLEAKYYLDVFLYPTLERAGHVLVPPYLKEQFQNDLNDAGIQYKITERNIKEKLDLEDARLSAASTRSKPRFEGEGLSFDTIHRYDVVDKYMEDLASSYSDTVTVVTAGKSFEGRDIKYLRISTTKFEDKTKPIIMIQSLLHAREWITLPVSLYAIQKLVLNVTEPELVRDVDWIILPILNPDGYEYSHESDRFWRKNRRTGLMIGNVCSGVDLNRNFDILWGQVWTDSFICSVTYHGRQAFSEPEARIVRDIFEQYGSRLKMFLDIHSYGSQIFYGYGNTVLPPNALQKHILGVAMAQAIDAVKWPENKDFVVGNLALMVGAPLVAGLGQDYALSVGIPYSYIFELPSYNQVESGDEGVLVDPLFIEQAGFQTWEAIKVAGRYVAENLRE